ncbi:MAG: amidohydrolase family protein [Alphaproteobacteria bacterium]|nr:amidohydrolase family protein [Alphaproteobacteria bacterium]
MAVIDIHTHMFGHEWLDMLKKHGAPDYGADRMADARDYLMEKGSPACALEDEAFDYDLRVKRMDQFGIDLAVVSLTSPNVFWGSAEISAKTAQLCNDEMAAGQAAHPARIRYLASLPWQYPEHALAELDRALENGAVGVMVLANIMGKHLIDPLFEPVWAEIDRRALPVLVHPTAPFGAKEAEFGRERILMPAAGFMFDTTLGVARMVLDGFFDRFEKVRIIAAHGGGYLPYVAGRIDMFFGAETLVDRKIAKDPSEYLAEIYYDTIVYDPGALDLCLEIAGPRNMLFGTDFPMPADIPKLHALIDRLPDDQAAAIKGGNAERIFNL